MCLMFEFPSIC